MPIPPDWSKGLRKFVEGWLEAPKNEPLSDDYLGDAPFDKFVLTESVSSWNEFLKWVNQLQGSWCFRGQRDAHWNLDTSLDLAVKRDFDGGYDHLERKPELHELLFLFRQQAHQYIADLPSSDDLGSWFALMQHHGAPTGFLDWTKSPYVALYFAFEEEPPEEGCALWAIDLGWLEQKARELLSKDTNGPVTAPATSAWDDFERRANYVNGFLRQTKTHVILQVNPLRLNPRMVAQQGFFLCKLYDQATFSQILMSMMTHPEKSDGPDIPDHPVVRKLVLQKELRIRFLKHLRAMNIHRASLFPGLDGLGKSLRLDLEMKIKS